MKGKKIGGWIVRDGIAAVDETSLPWGLTPLYPAEKVEPRNTLNTRK